MAKLSRVLLGITLASTAVGLAGCASLGAASGTNQGKGKPITVVFYPNESAKSFEGSRQALKTSLEKATGKPIKLQTTTDYNVAIQAIASGKAQLSYMGANGYIQAQHISKNVIPFAAQSDADGTLKKATYNSYLMVQKKDAPKYQRNGKYSIKSIRGKKVSFVSSSSTSGMLVPAAEIQKEFKIKNPDTIAQSGKFFNKVMFGGSHQGSAVNLMKGDVDVAAFDDEDLTPYLDVTKGTWDKVGSTFTVKNSAEDPFGSLKGKQVVDIAVMPVQQGPWVLNNKTLSKTDQTKITNLFTSKKFANNHQIFSEKDAKTPKLFQKTSSKTQLLKVDDQWYKPTHDLVGE